MSDFKMGSRDTSYESTFSATPTTTDEKQKLANEEDPCLVSAWRCRRLG